MQDVKVYVISAFSKDGGGGNKAGVVFDRPDLSEKQMMAIAKELGYAETAFVTESEAADYRLRYFTPAEEVPLCGHATIATFSAIRLLGLSMEQDFTIETAAGVLSISVDTDGLVFMEQNCPEFYEELAAEEFQGCIDTKLISTEMPIRIVSTGLKDIILPVVSSEKLDEIRPDFKVMTKLSAEKNVVGVHAYALTGEGEPVAICRNFAPLYDIDEESATGTSNCALAGLLFASGIKKDEYVFEQGYSMGAPSRIIVRIKYHGDSIDAIYAGGYGYLVEERQVSLLG